MGGGQAPASKKELEGLIVTQDLAAPRGYSSAVALGFFDGVHIGHREVIGAAVRAAKAGGLVPCVFTFRPSGVLPAGKSALTLLQTEEQKEEVFRSLGVEEAVCPAFSEFQAMSPEGFVRDFLHGVMGAKVISCGFNYHFGKGGAAGVEELRALCRPLGIRVEAVPAVLWEGEPVSSTRIRGCIREGRMEEAAGMLGSPFTLELPVVHGKRLARTQSWPTINQIFPPDFTIPRHGVYYSRAVLDGREWAAITNVGVKPTLHETNLTMETYILDYTGDLYGRTIPVSLLKFLRPEMKFASVEELSGRIREDIKAVRELAGA